MTPLIGTPEILDKKTRHTKPIDTKELCKNKLNKPNSTKKKLITRNHILVVHVSISYHSFNYQNIILEKYID